MGLSESMRQDWDARAQKDALFYIASWRKDWTTEDFLRSGEEDYRRLVAPFLARFNFSPEEKVMVELGCGAGRMTRTFATRFRKVIALDISSEMLRRGQQLLSGMGNIAWTQANGVDLRGIPDHSVDFVFSYMVLQHLPEEHLVRAYVREMLRVLGPSGLCLFQFHGTKKPTMNWRGRAAWAALDSLSRWGIGPAARWWARMFGFDPEMVGNNWHGAPVRAEVVIETVKAAQGQILEVVGEDTPAVWCGAIKNSA